MPVYDKPMIYYPLTTLMLAGIREILIITTPRDQEPHSRALLGDGSQRARAAGIRRAAESGRFAQAFLIGEGISRRRPAALVLGDQHLSRATARRELCRADGTAGRDGVRLLRARSRSATAWSSSMQPDARCRSRKTGATEVQITRSPACTLRCRWSRGGKAVRPWPGVSWKSADVSRIYLERGRLNVELMGRGYAWLDTGTHDSLLVRRTIHSGRTGPPGAADRLVQKKLPGASAGSTPNT